MVIRPSEDFKIAAQCSVASSKIPARALPGVFLILTHRPALSPRGPPCYRAPQRSPAAGGKKSALRARKSEKSPTAVATRTCPLPAAARKSPPGETGLRRSHARGRPPPAPRPPPPRAFVPHARPGRAVAARGGKSAPPAGGRCR